MRKIILFTSLLLIPGSMFGMLRKVGRLRTALRRLAPRTRQLVWRSLPMVLMQKRTLHNLDSNKMLEKAFVKIQEKKERERLEKKRNREEKEKRNVQKRLRNIPKIFEKRQSLKEAISNNQVVQQWGKKIVNNNGVVGRWAKKMGDGSQFIGNIVKNNPINQRIDEWIDERDQKKRDQIIATVFYKNEQLPKLHKRLSYLKSKRFVAYRWVETVFIFPFCFSFIIPPHLPGIVASVFAFGIITSNNYQLETRQETIKDLEKQIERNTKEINIVLAQLNKEERETI